jgi:hypothetical protein
VDEMNRDLKTFEEVVPYGEEAFMVLKAQLLAEHSLAQYVDSRVPSLIKEVQDRNSPVRSGLALILLAQALSLRDEVPPTCSETLWPALKALNTLRNDLAHNLYPNTDKVIGRMRDFVGIVLGEPLGSGENLNRQFYLCAKTVVGYLAIDRKPLTLSDTECP